MKQSFVFTLTMRSLLPINRDRDDKTTFWSPSLLNLIIILSYLISTYSTGQVTINALSFRLGSPQARQVGEDLGEAQSPTLARF